MDLVYCHECRRDADSETHPPAWSTAHRDFVKQRALSTPMSLPVNVARNRAGLTGSQLRARDEVLADRRSPRRPLSLREAEASISELRSPDDTRRANEALDSDMMTRLALGPRSAVGELEIRVGQSSRRNLGCYPDESADFIRPV